MSLAPPPERIWWKPIGKQEKLWVIIATTWCIFMFVAMVGWYFVGDTNVPIETYRTTPAEFATKTEAFIAEYKIGTEQNVPVVSKLDGGDIYMYGKQWQWYPVLELKKGQEYRLHLSSIDVQHGFSLQPQNLNFQVLPGSDYVLTFTPMEAGDYGILCNEYCLGVVAQVGHHTMTGKIVVKE